MGWSSKQLAAMAASTHLFLSLGTLPLELPLSLRYFCEGPLWLYAQMLCHKSSRHILGFLPFGMCLVYWNIVEGLLWPIPLFLAIQWKFSRIWPFRDFAESTLNFFFLPMYAFFFATFASRFGFAALFRNCGRQQGTWARRCRHGGGSGWFAVGHPEFAWLAWICTVFVRWSDSLVIASVFIFLGDPNSLIKYFYLIVSYFIFIRRPCKAS